jgi:hypothetical protein
MRLDADRHSPFSIVGADGASVPRVREPVAGKEREE